jgi:Acetyltransferase (GNAT) domain
MELITDTNHSLFSVTSNGDFPIFFTRGYSDFLTRQNKILGLIYDKKTNAIIPVKIWKSKILNYITCLYRPMRDGVDLAPIFEKVFLDKLVVFIAEQKLADRISAPENFALFQETPNDAIIARFGTYKVKLYPLRFEYIFAHFQARYRSAINNAQKVGIIIKYGASCLNDFYILHQLTMKRSNMYTHPKEYFEAYLNTMPESVHIAVAYSNEEAVGAILIVYNHCSAYYLYGCSSDNTHASGAIKYLHSDAMKLFCEKGVRQYDFVGARLSNVEGTKLYGIQAFKSRFGSQLMEGLIWKKDINLLKCKISDNLLYVRAKLTNRLLPKDIIDQELLKC